MAISEQLLDLGVSPVAAQDRLHVVSEEVGKRLPVSRRSAGGPGAVHAAGTVLRDGFRPAAADGTDDPGHRLFDADPALSGVPDLRRHGDLTRPVRRRPAVGPRARRHHFRRPHADLLRMVRSPGLAVRHPKKPVCVGFRQ
jgi:hypothetical protein